MTYQEVLNAVNKYYSDTSRTPEETKEGLESLVDEIDMLIETLP